LYSKPVKETLAGEDFHSAIAYLGADIHNRGREGSGLDLVATEMVIGQKFRQSMRCFRGVSSHDHC
jgi:hypothetical protein